jgi:hypothetical protein
MAIVGGLDIHRRQITYDWVDTDTGQARHGRIQPATRVELRAWLARLAVCRRGGHGRRVSRPSGGAGRHPGAARPQAAGQDRPGRRPPPA